MSYTQEEIEKAYKITRECEAEFWRLCSEHVKETISRIHSSAFSTQVASGVIGATYTRKITISGSWKFTIGGFERIFIGDAVVEIDNSEEIGRIKRISFHSDMDGRQMEFNY